MRCVKGNVDRAEITWSSITSIDYNIRWKYWDGTLIGPCYDLIGSILFQNNIGITYDPNYSAAQILKDKWSEIDRSGIGVVTINNGYQSAALVHKISDLYGSFILFGYAEANVNFYTLTNGTWSDGKTL